MRKIHLLANAHIDPVWQWDIAEGIGAALATFRSAEMLVRNNPGFVFNHNEALLYRWIKEYDPPLFERISSLIREGRWHVMGGFELQPDCVMPMGETMLRQIMQGRRYFISAFGVAPTVAANLDSFGHSRGLVQILKKAGYKAYLYQRPSVGFPQTFMWEGFDGSRLLAHCIDSGYGTQLGRAREALTTYIAGHNSAVELFPWGVGNHGGGPSQQDIDDLNALAHETTNAQIIHSTPEAFVGEYLAQTPSLDTVSQSIYPSNVGCYTSMLDIKHAHRMLENTLLMAEKCASLASLASAMQFPDEELSKAWQALSFIQFHDVLPGTHTKPVKQRMLKKAGFGSELAHAVLMRAFFRLLSYTAPAPEGMIPLLALNPHPYPVAQILECEYMLPDQNWDEGTVTDTEIMLHDTVCPSQLLQEDSRLALDWRKRVAFFAVLPPMSLTRFDARLVVHPAHKRKFEQNFQFRYGSLYAAFDLQTGWLETYEAGGTRQCAPGLGAIDVFEDDADPWHMRSHKINQYLHTMRLAKPLRVTEDGSLFTQVEVKYETEGASAVLNYRIHKLDDDITLHITLTNTAPCRMYKLRIPGIEVGQVLCESMFGEEYGFADGTENVSQRYDVMKASGLGVINDGVYGGSFDGRTLYKNLLRSAAYCAHPILDRPLLSEDREASYMGIGQYDFYFVLSPGAKNIARRAQIVNQPPLMVSAFPSGEIQKSITPLVLDGKAILSAFTRAADGRGFVARVFNPEEQENDIALSFGPHCIEARLHPFELAAYCLTDNGFEPCDILV